MLNPLTALELIIHLKDGNILKFFQNDETAAQKILDSIHPKQFFEQPDVTIAGRYSMTVYPIAGITRIEFVTELQPNPSWPLPPWIHSIAEIPAAEFRRTWTPEDPPHLPRKQHRLIGEVYMQYCEVEFDSGEPLYLAIRMRETMEIEQRHLVRQLMGSIVHAERIGGGIMLINPAHVLRITFSPGTNETPPNVWPAHRMTFTAVKEALAAGQFENWEN
jgi:hypothetical protein